MLKEVYERLGIETDLKEEMERFLNRLIVTFKRLSTIIDYYHFSYTYEELGFNLGTTTKVDFGDYLGKSFERNLVVSEVLLSILKGKGKSPYQESYKFLRERLKEAIETSVLDLGVIFENDKFIKKGAKTLDRIAVIEPLEWLKGYPITKEYFESALTHYLSKNYSDAITNAYSALESLVKTVLNKDRTLDNLIGDLLRVLNLPSQWNSILVNFCNFAHEFSSRHGRKEEAVKEDINPAHAEAYIYFTGLMIRLIIQSIISLGKE